MGSSPTGGINMVCVMAVPSLLHSALLHIEGRGAGQLCNHSRDMHANCAFDIITNRPFGVDFHWRYFGLLPLVDEVNLHLPVATIVATRDIWHRRRAAGQVPQRSLRGAESGKRQF